jgi:tetraacyldisaccharide 4'-kinase
VNWFNKKWPALLLWPLSLLYGAILSLRNFFYDVGLFKSYSVDSYVISVGNITVGGTGKTPTVLYLARKFISLGKRVAIISRGYGRSSRGTVIVADGRNILVPVDKAGDEPFLLAQSCSAAIVIVDSDRVQAARLAVAKFHPDVILLDDAFQHRRIRRDFDLVTIRQALPFGNGFCLPAGPLREPKRHLSRAEAILFNGEKEQVSEKFGPFVASAIVARYNPIEFVNKKGEILPVQLGSRTVFAFCGLANPNSFHTTLKNLSVNLIGFAAYNDHYHYNKDDIKKIAQQLTNADIIVTTEKDWVKLPLDLLNEHWYRLRIEIKPIDEEKIVSLFDIPS